MQRAGVTAEQVNYSPIDELISFSAQQPQISVARCDWRSDDWVDILQNHSLASSVIVELFISECFSYFLVGQLTLAKLFLLSVT